LHPESKGQTAQEGTLVNYYFITLFLLSVGHRHIPVLYLRVDGMNATSSLLGYFELAALTARFFARNMLAKKQVEFWQEPS
jgi:hypothetical protein